MLTYTKLVWKFRFKEPKLGRKQGAYQNFSSVYSRKWSMLWSKYHNWNFALHYTTKLCTNFFNFPQSVQVRFHTAVTWFGRSSWEAATETQCWRSLVQVTLRVTTHMARVTWGMTHTSRCLVFTLCHSCFRDSVDVMEPTFLYRKSTGNLRVFENKNA